MKFKLLHVRPHVWFFKQKETISKATSDDSSSEGPPAYVYKRSTSLKLVKSDPSLDIAKHMCNPSKPSSNTPRRSQKQGKDVQVCTVVDAGCTCRATVTSQHKQKKGLGVYPNANGGLGSLHDVCRPRWAQVFEAKEDVGSKHDVCRPRWGPAQPNAKRAAFPNVSPPLSTGNSVVSRLVCKSSHDVVKHSQLDVEHCDVVCKSLNDESKQCDARASYGGEKAAGLDVHQLDCRLRNAGVEEWRRSSKKKNKYYEEGPSISSGISSSNISTNTNTDSLITCTTTEMQDMLLNTNPAFDTDATSMGDTMLSLEDLRASIAQRKLANHNLQASLCGKDAAPIDGMHENVASTHSPESSLSSESKVACGISPSFAQNLVGHACEEDSNKHSNVGVNKKLCFSECNDLSNQGLTKQSPRKACRDTFRGACNEAVRDDSRLLRKASRRIDLSAQKGLDAQQEVKKSSVNRVSTGSARGEVHEVPKKSHEADNRSEVRFPIPEGPICAGADDDNGQEKQVVTSSSCEIQVLSDYSYDHHSDGNHTYPMIQMHVNGTSSTGAVPHVQSTARSLQAILGMTSLATPVITAASSHVQGAARHALEPNSLGHELMRSDSAVAMVKSSYDPKRDFKESMLEMVVAKQLRTPRQLQQLLQCYLSLNPSHYHPTIIKVFHELCSELFD